MTTNAIWRVIKKYARAVGLDDMTPHTLRHTFATLLLRKYKVDLPTVSELLGHENFSSRVIYTGPNQEDLENAVDNLSKLKEFPVASRKKI